MFSGLPKCSQNESTTRFQLGKGVGQASFCEVEQVGEVCGANKGSHAKGRRLNIVLGIISAS
jgi:hypothetical protein